MSEEPIFLSLVIPVYNEAKRIPWPLRQMGAYLCAQSYSSEIVIVDDGSWDGTSEAAQKAADEIEVPVRFLRYERNRGKGYAIKVGFEAARGTHILFSDADLSTPIEQARRLLDAITQGAEIAIGTRKGFGAEIAVHQPFLREYAGKGFTFLVRHLLVDVSDVTCGFKLFRADVGKDLFARSRIADWSFDAEVLFLASRGGHPTTEVPIHWEDREGTKVNILRDAIISLVGLIRIRAHAALGYYRSLHPTGPYAEIWANPAAVQAADTARRREVTS